MSGLTEGSPVPAAASEASLGRTYLRLVGLGALIGAPAALVAALFLAAVHQLENVLWPDDPGWYAVLGLPVAGAVVVIAARRLLPGDGGHSPLLGVGGGATPLSYAPGIALAAIGTLAFGAVLGPEAPLIALGSVVGVAGSKLIRAGANDQEATVLATAGSFSAISSLFGGPIVGGMMMTEFGLAMGAKLIPALIPGFVAAAVGYVLFIGLGNWGGIHTQVLAVPGLPEYKGTTVFDLLLAIAVGILAAVAIVGVRRLGKRISDDGGARFGMARLLLMGGLAVGVLAEIAELLGTSSQDVLFSGQTGIPDLIKQGSTSAVLVLLAAKGLGYAVSLGCGFRGGPVFPAIFLGVAFGTLCVVWFNVSPTLAVAVGTAAGMAALTRLMLTPIVFAALLVGHNGADAVPAAVLAAAAAWMTTAVLNPADRAQPQAPSLAERSRHASPAPQ
jgi:chloride channel protein, CIC family